MYMYFSRGVCGHQGIFEAEAAHLGMRAKRAFVRATGLREGAVGTERLRHAMVVAGWHIDRGLVPSLTECGCCICRLAGLTAVR